MNRKGIGQRALDVVRYICLREHKDLARNHDYAFFRAAIGTRWELTDGLGRDVTADHREVPGLKLKDFRAAL